MRLLRAARFTEQELGLALRRALPEAAEGATTLGLVCALMRETAGAVRERGPLYERPCNRQDTDCIQRPCNREDTGCIVPSPAGGLDEHVCAMYAVAAMLISVCLTCLAGRPGGAKRAGPAHGQERRRDGG